jgi:DNA-binding HxlR family transcriptional regulator
MRTYRHYCPIARGAEIFAERWTPLIIRNLHLGGETFGEILDGPSCLVRALPSLERPEHIRSTSSPTPAPSLGIMSWPVIERVPRGCDAEACERQ